MSGKMELIGTLGSLSDTLAKRNDPSFPVDLQALWFGAQWRISTIANRTGDLMALPRKDPRYAPIIAELHGATVALVNAKSNAKREAALTSAGNACGMVEDLLDDN